MGRVQTLVQLNQGLLSALDQIAAATGKSRSEVVREALERYLSEVLETQTDRQIVAAYTQVPQRDDPAWVAALKGSLAEESW